MAARFKAHMVLDISNRPTVIVGWNSARSMRSMGPYPFQVDLPSIYSDFLLQNYKQAVKAEDK
jgi:hypothetical protein